MLDVNTIWEAVLAKLKGGAIGDSSFESYIAVNKPVSIDDEKLVLGVGNSFLQQWIENNYKGMISDALMLVVGKKLNIEWHIDNEEPRVGTEQEEPEVRKSTSKKARRSSEQGRCYGVLNPDFTFDEFVVGSSNSFTYAAAKAVAQSPGQAYNPLFIYGDTGLGKTHLMQAVGHELLSKGKIIAYITTEALLNEYSDAILNKTTLEFRHKYRKVDLLMIDDIQFFAGKQGVQEEFFHTFNELYQGNKQIIITSDRPASEVSGLEKRLVSRFNAGLSVQMESPNFEMRLAILRYKLAHLNVKIGDAAEMFIAENVKSNVRNLEGAMKRAIAYKNLNPGAALSIDELRLILRDLMEEDQRESISSEAIRKTVCDFYGIELDDLNKEGRIQSIVIPRQVAMYLCRVLLKDSSLPSIAKIFDRTHANIYHACKKIKGLYQTDETIHGNIVAILGKLGKDPSVLQMLTDDANS